MADLTGLKIAGAVIGRMGGIVSYFRKPQLVVSRVFLRNVPVPGRIGMGGMTLVVSQLSIIIKNRSQKDIQAVSVTAKPIFHDVGCKEILNRKESTHCLSSVVGGGDDVEVRVDIDRMSQGLCEHSGVEISLVYKDSILGCYRTVTKKFKWLFNAREGALITDDLQLA